MNEEQEKLESSLSNVGSTAFLIAYERAVESERADALFTDKLAKDLHGERGKVGSDMMRGLASAFGFDDWQDYHMQWTACRTAFIDRWITSNISEGQFTQFVNLGAGIDTRPFRLDCFKPENSIFEVDMEDLNGIKEYYYQHIIHTTSISRRVSVNCDLSTATLDQKLAEAGFDKEKLSIWLVEGLLMYLGKESQKSLLEQLSVVAVSGSKAVFNVMDVREHESKGYTVQGYVDILQSMGWSTQAIRFGDADLNFGRYPAQYEPNSSFTLIVSSKI